MTDWRENLGWLIGSIATAITLALGWLFESGVLNTIVGIVVGAGIALFIQSRTQKRAWKREDFVTMRDKIYGPIFRELNEISADIEDSQTYYLLEHSKKLTEITAHYLFHNMKRDLISKFIAILDGLEKYESIHHATQTLVLQKIRDEVKKSYQLDIQISLGQVRLSLQVVEGAIQVGSIMLEKAILQRMHPEDFVRTKREEWEDLFVKVWIGGEKRSLEDFVSLYENVLNDLESEPLFQAEKKQRESIIQELEAFLKEIKTFITVE